MKLMKSSRFSAVGLCLASCLMFSGISSVLFAQAYPLDDVQQAVVKIEGSDKKPGTGFVFFISKNKAYIMTAYHVVENYDIPNENKFPVKFISEDRNYSATVEWVRKKIDLAILSLIEYPENLRPLKLGNLKDIKIGTEVFIYGYPEGDKILRDAGSVSRQPGSDKIDLDDIAPRKGNSGSPLLSDQTDEVVGMIIQRSEDVIEQYAIGIDDIRDYLRGISIFSPISTSFEATLSRRRMAMYSLALPGSGQLYGGRRVSGAAFLATGIGAVAGAVVGYVKYSRTVDDHNNSKKAAYDNAVGQYNNAVALDEIEIARSGMEDSYGSLTDARDSARSMLTFSRVAFGAAGAVWALSAIHAYMTGPATAAPSPQTEVSGWDIAPQVTPEVAGIMIWHRF